MALVQRLTLIPPGPGLPAARTIYTDISKDPWHRPEPEA